jgi:3-oxoacyl-[acyl-carrier protein] reductase
LDLGLRGTIALVTGGSSGIGAACARVLAEEGADVLVAYWMNRLGADATVAAVRQAGRRAWPVRMDVTDALAVASAVDGATEREGITRLDVVVLCAGQNVVTPFEALTPDEWDRVVRVNLHGPFHVLRAVRPLLREGASVVTVASVAAHTGAPHHAHYAAAKAGLVNFTKSAARALAPAVRVNCVAPGITLTEMGRETAAALSPDYVSSRLLSGRFAEPEEIARLVVFLASPVASFVTGATLDANGGRDLR